MSPEHLMMPITSFSDLWSPFYIALTLVIGVLYFMLIRQLKRRFEVAPQIPFYKGLFFILGLVCFYAGEGSPIAFYSHQLFSVHMLQMSILYFFMPPLLLLGIPIYLLREMLKIRAIHVFLIPSTIVAAFLFNLLLSVYHLPLIFNYVMNHMILHVIYHVILLATSFQMWWPILAPVREYNRLAPLRRLGYIIVTGLILTPACMMIIGANTVLYPLYDHNPQISWLVGPLDDQQLGGTIMKLVQEIVFGVALAGIFFQWVNQARINDGVDVDVDLELSERK
jgi:putative membrane protein